LKLSKVFQYFTNLDLTESFKLAKLKLNKLHKVKEESEGEIFLVELLENELECTQEKIMEIIKKIR